MTPLEYAVVPLGLIYAYTNGRSDSPAIISTVLAVRAQDSRKTRIFCAIFEFIGAAFLGQAIANTMARGVLAHEHINHITRITIAASAMTGAITWTYLNLKLGLPSSSSHSLIGGLIGSTFILGQSAFIQWSTLKTIAAWLLAAPALGFILALLLMRLGANAFSSGSPRLNILFKRLSLPFALVIAMLHGSNDGQKALGMVALGMSIPLFNHYATHIQYFCAIAIALGIAVGGWKTATRLGRSLYEIKPIHGFSAQLPSILTLVTAMIKAMPISCTHVLSSAIVGAGAAFRPKRLRWSLVEEILTSWLVTIPAACILSMIWCIIFTYTSTLGFLK